MSKFIKSTIALSLALAMSNVIADEQLDMYSTDVPDIELTPQEETALELTQKVQNRNNIPVSEGGNGYIQYVYGAQKATVVCKPLSICDCKFKSSFLETLDFLISPIKRLRRENSSLIFLISTPFLKIIT